MEFNQLSPEQRKNIFIQAASQIGISEKLIEKDWWVCAVLKALYTLPYSNFLSFKGGTSLSKCWKLIDRFSEDVDIAIDREYLGFSGPLSKTQISDKLRRAACSFVREKLQYELGEALTKIGLESTEFSIYVNISPITTTDPETIIVGYTSLFQSNPYIKDTVKIEVSGRSMGEPVQELKLRPIIDETFPSAAFSGDAFAVRAVLPERTFLEKLFLLHEEFAKPSDDIRVERMSRHFYDIGQILKTPIAQRAIADETLYDQVIEHRKMFIGLRGFDYSTLSKSTLNFIPPASVYAQWKTDYENMREHMIYGNSLPYEELIEQLKAFNAWINGLV